MSPARWLREEFPTIKEDVMPSDAKQMPTPRTSFGARGARKGADARHDPERQKENQRRLNVGSDHRTEAMRKGRRGTFP